MGIVLIHRNDAAYQQKDVGTTSREVVMSQMTLTILDADRAIHGQPHAAFADIVVAALSADPESINELEAALVRFGETDCFTGWSKGVGEEPYDAGICFVDLTARMVVSRSSYSFPCPTGEVRYREGRTLTDIWLPYHVSDDWLLSKNVESWQALAEERRKTILRSDARDVLYGKVCGFIAEQCLAARGDAPKSNHWTPPDGWTLCALTERLSESDSPTAADAVAEIHARWLISPREDLQGQSPRDLLLARKEHIDFDLQDRSLQWSRLRECPPGLSEYSAAYRYAGFGMHENVIYYDFVRHLTWECWERIVEPKGEIPKYLTPGDEAMRLDHIKEDWLSKPQMEDLGGRCASEVIERERMRLPMGVSGKEAMVDHDCPVCQMMADDAGPYFWFLDGCNMDDDFPFSFHKTREQWEKERREWEDVNRRFEEEQNLRQAGLSEVNDPATDIFSASSSVWQRSFSSPDVADASPSIALFGIGSHLAELGADLRESPETAPLAELVNRQFSNLRETIGGASLFLLEPVMQRFCEELHTVTEARPDLREKCEDLERQINLVAAKMSDEGHRDDEYRS